MQSNGYCQGDSVLLLAIALPSWVQLVGAPLDTCERQCKNACDLYGAWAWGDVYGIASITAPGTVDEDGDETEGEEIPDGSVWGFYGHDHAASGLLEAARESVNYHKKQSALEASEAHEMACRDIPTV